MSSEDIDILRTRLLQCQQRRMKLQADLDLRQQLLTSDLPSVELQRNAEQQENVASQNIEPLVPNLITLDSVNESASDFRFVTEKRQRDRQQQSRHHSEMLKDLNDRRMKILEEINTLRNTRNELQPNFNEEISEMSEIPQTDKYCERMLQFDTFPDSMPSTVQKVSSLIPASEEKLHQLRAGYTDTLLQAEVSKSYSLGNYSIVDESDVITAKHIEEEENRCKELEEQIRRTQKEDVYLRAIQAVMRKVLFEVVLAIADEVSSEVCFSHSWARTVAGSIVIASTSDSAAEDEKDGLLDILEEFQSFRSLRQGTNAHTLPVVSSARLSAENDAMLETNTEKGGSNPSDKGFEASANNIVGKAASNAHSLRCRPLLSTKPRSRTGRATRTRSSRRGQAPRPLCRCSPSCRRMHPGPARPLCRCSWAVTGCPKQPAL